MKVSPSNKVEIESFLETNKKQKSLNIVCYGCEGQCKKSRSRIQAAIKNNTTMFCSSVCFIKWKKRNSSFEYKCNNCSRLVIRSPSQVSNFVYCSQSCAATVNGSKYVKRKKGKSVNCQCGVQIQSQSKQCQQCRFRESRNITLVRIETSTFADYKKKADNKSHLYYNRIRTDARFLAENIYEMKKECMHCGYSTYVELAHIKALSSFDDRNTGSEMNARENLVYLCPNHHKEQEMGLIQVAKT